MAVPSLEPLDAFSVAWDRSGELRRLPFGAESSPYGGRGAVGPDAVWFQATATPAPAYQATDIFVGRYDLDTFQLLDWWILPSSKESREPVPLMLRIISVDRGGIWYESGGVTYRFDL